MFRSEYDTYSFVKADPKNNVMLVKGVMVGIRQTEAESFIRTRYGSNRNLEYGIEALQGENYEFATRMYYSTTADEVAESLYESGHLMPTCILKKQFSRIEYKNVLKFIDYWEDAAKSGYACDKWKDERSLDDRQNAYLMEFSKRAKESFTVIKAVK